MSFKSDLETLTLGVLQAEDLHGYEILKRINQASEETLQVWEGRLYPTLHKLEKEGFVVALWVPQEGKPPRKVYSLTDAGRGRLVEQRKVWKEFAQAVERLLAPGKSAVEGSR